MEANEKINILAVDDNPANLLVLEGVLDDPEYNLIQAQSGREALKYLLKYKDFALILMDVYMPEMSGIELTRIIRSRNKNKDIPIIFITAEDKGEEHITQGYALKAVDYILKPFNQEILKTKVTVFVDLYKKTKQIKDQAEMLRKSEKKLEQLVEELQQTNEQLLTEVNERKEAQDEVQKLNEDLESRVLKRTQELESANKGQSALVKELEAFSYSVSHDLRAPLRHITGYANLLKKHAASKMDEKGNRYIEVILSSGKKMGELIDDLLQFSHMNRMEIHNRDFPTNQLVEEVLKTFEEEITERSIEFQISNLPSICADRAMIRQAFVNLFSNAIKYSRNKKQAIITITCKLENEEYTFSVSDNGAGFDMQYKQKLFGVFQRLHRADEFEGTGIGLANVRRIISRHGGRVWAEGKINEGATFFFTIPQSLETKK
jgi:two-component system sensor histidine kinase/response regulator